MTRKIKGLGLAFVAIAAMSMASASAAQATQLHATTELDEISLFGDQEQQHTFLTKAGQVKCNSTLLEATVSDEGQSTPQQLTAQELTVTATYGNGVANPCTAFGLAASVVMNGCKYTITNKSGAGVTTSKTAYVDITGCTQGKQIEVKNGAGCVVTVPEQHNLAKIDFTNVAGQVHDVTADIDVQGITYEGHGACPNLQGVNATKLFHDGRYHGQSTFQAREEGINDVVQLHGHQYTKLGQEGALKSIEAT